MNKISATTQASTKEEDAIALETCFNEDQKHIWKKVLKVEKIKKDKSLQKTIQLRQKIYIN